MTCILYMYTQYVPLAADSFRQLFKTRLFTEY